jgi:hypothetical protein
MDSFLAKVYLPNPKSYETKLRAISHLANLRQRSKGVEFSLQAVGHAWLWRRTTTRPRLDPWKIQNWILDTNLLENGLKKVEWHQFPSTRRRLSRGEMRWPDVLLCNFILAQCPRLTDAWSYWPKSNDRSELTEIRFLPIKQSIHEWIDDFLNEFIT